jgi:hypothetical protein
MSGDKKMNFQNFIKGRGTSVVADCFIPGRVLERVLHVTPHEFALGWMAGAVGGAEIGMIGSDVNTSNILGAIYTATGQDIACVYESSGAVFSVMEENDGLQATIHIPALIIGTVGGGTHLPTQRECLEIMKCYGPNKLFRFAEIIGASCLSLALSTMAAIYTNEFVSAHEKLGRNRPTNKLAKSEIKEAFFEDILFDKSEKVVDVVEKKIDTSTGIISSILEEKKSIFTGIFNYILTKEDEKGVQKEVSTILKVKADDTELINMGVGIARLSGEDRLPGLFETNIDVFGYTNSHIREIEFYRNVKKEVLDYCPKIYGLKNVPDRNLFAILMEDVSGLSHFNTVNEPEKYWNKKNIELVLEQLAGMHSIYFDKFDQELADKARIHRLDIPSVKNAVECIYELTNYNASRFPELINKECLLEYRQFLKNFSQYIIRMISYPITLTHNDFHPRNICLRQEENGMKMVVYDWELAAFQNPQHDLIEFLIYVLPEEATMETFHRYFEFYFKCLQEKTGKKLIKDEFIDVLYLNALELGVIRYNIYLLTHNLLKYEYIERVYKNLRKIILEYKSSKKELADKRKVKKKKE